MPEEWEHIKSHRFLLRVWEEEIGDGRREVRGQLKHILTGETAYFREWPNLLLLLQRRLEVTQVSDNAVDRIDMSKGSSS